ncbi:Superfamily I DNA and RNA helicase [Serinicoccus hydrothermalis]|uniref:Superfamily I DNA and RNA helicase n=1 Tax=Serinicoccus hydrothermalis TaxID=1758689 RepID=A0A1B1NBG5_9MICO|nr:Superfamily I DNA and RNA helicase [Serinicoccus hydrothermalis]
MNTLDEARVEAVQRARTRWRHEVAELGGANSLLWHRTSLTGTFDLNLAHPGGVAKLLSGRPTPLSDLVREQVAFADAARRLGGIRDKVTEMRREHGLETSFLAIGLATWTLHRVPVPPRAPVLLRACTITPTDAAHSDFVLELHEDVVFNPVLEHYLRSEAHLQPDPALLAGLSAQSHGFDPRLTYRALEDICIEMAGFAIGPQMVISTFPWAKLPLVTSYTGDPEPLAAHDVVAALAGADVRLTPSAPDPERAEDAARELSALDADASQRLVVDEVSHGGDLVLDTPSGTGATQTIANVVVGALSEGRTVMVCSEDRSTLQAVRRRLDAVGLGDLCLQLAEDPASMRQTLAEVRRRLDRLPSEDEPDLGPDPLPARADALSVLQREQEVLHREHEPWGLSLARTEDDLSALATSEHPPTSRVRLHPDVLRTLTDEELSAVTDALIEAADCGAWSTARAEDPWYAARLTSEDEATRATEIVGRLVSGEFSTAREQADAVCRAAGMPAPATLRQWGHRLGLVARASDTLDHFAPGIYDAPLEQMVAALGPDRDAGVQRPGAVARARLRRQVRQQLRPGTPPADLAQRVRMARDEGREWEEVAGKAARPTAPEGWEEALAAQTPIGEDLEWLEQALTGTSVGHELSTTHLDTVLERLVRLDARADRAAVAAQAHPLLAPLREQGLGELVDDLARRGVPADRVAQEVRFVHRSSVLDHLTSDEVPQQVGGEAVREAERSFRAADRAHLRRNALRARRAVLRRLRRTLAGHGSQLGAWQRALEETRLGAVDSRDVISRAPDVVLAAAPVLLASPLVVPAVLPPDLTVDLVVVDRAGRTTTARTAPALARGRQVLVVGDSGGPGPRHFSVVADPQADGDPGPMDEPSLLAEVAKILPVRHLGTHYRALDQGLVAPLAPLMPRPVHSFPGVWRGASVREHVVDGHVSARIEAAVRLVLKHARSGPDSLLLVTDDEAGAEDAGIALRAAMGSAGLPASLSDDEQDSEAFLVLPVHRVAGQTRDRVVWVGSPAAVGSAEAAGAVLAGARRSVDLVTPTPVADWPTAAGHGAEIVRHALVPDAEEHGHGSAVLTELVRRLRSEGLQVKEGVGHGPHVVDLAVVSEEDDARYAVAVDGDVQNGSAPRPGRDDVRLRHDQLTRMGWAPVRVRTTDVFTDPAREVARVLQALRERTR